MKQAEVRASGVELYNAILRQAEKNGQPLDPQEQHTLAVALKLGETALNALISLSRSLETIANAERFRMGWMDPED